VGSDPYAVAFVAKEVSDGIGSDIHLFLEEILDVVSVITAQSRCCADPDIAVLVSAYIIYGVCCQTAKIGDVYEAGTICLCLDPI
jgi:hypothetical protein